MKLVPESLNELNFERGRDPKRSMGIGAEETFKKYMEGWSYSGRGTELLHHFSYWDNEVNPDMLKLIISKKGEDIGFRDIEKAIHDLCGKSYSGRNPDNIFQSVKFLMGILDNEQKAFASLSSLGEAADETWNSGWNPHQAKRDLFDFLFQEAQRDKEKFRDRLPYIFRSMLSGGYETARFRAAKKIASYGDADLLSGYEGPEIMKNLLSNRYKESQKLSILRALYQSGQKLKNGKYLRYALKENLPNASKFLIEEVGIRVTPGLIEWASQWPEVEKTLQKANPGLQPFEGHKKNYYLNSDVERVNMGYGSMAADTTWELYDMKGKLISRHNQNSWDDDKFRDWKAFVRSQGIDPKEVEKK
jgi:hypothetical protein